MTPELKRLNMFVKMMGETVPSSFSDWLADNGFFLAPASTKFHGDYEGGLFDHSFAVTEELVALTEKLNLQWTRKQSPWIVGMFHDLCKIDEYQKVVDVEGTVMMGSSEVKGEEAHWEHSNDSVLKGHGDKSIMLLSQFMTLTEEEMLCIRYHMGAYNGREDWEGYDKAIRKYETVLWTHTADMYASKVKNT